MKLAVLVLGLLVLTVPAQAEPRNFELILTGLNGNPPHENVDKALRKMVGGFVENLKVKNYHLREIPAGGGGFNVCIEPNEPGGYDYIEYELSKVGVTSAAKATWQINLVESCELKPAPPIKDDLLVH